jgi:hypothetical protein
LSDEVGHPFNQIPTEGFTAFKSGVYGWGSICGALVPAIYAINLVAEGEEQVAMINELMAWYKDTPFPIYQPAGMNLPTTVADSSLCHVSVTKFMQELGIPRDDPQRKERCGGLTADVAKFTVAMLNDYADKSLTTGVFKPSSAVGECMACHSSISWAHGKESCVLCHGDPHND